MTRADKIKKLANAIREYRGLSAGPPVDGKVNWIQTPKPAAGERVIKWLAELGRPVQADFVKINHFAKLSDFNAWLKELEQPVEATAV